MSAKKHKGDVSTIMQVVFVLLLILLTFTLVPNLILLTLAAHSEAKAHFVAQSIVSAINALSNAEQGEIYKEFSELWNIEIKKKNGIEPSISGCGEKWGPACHLGNIWFCPGDDVSDWGIARCPSGYTCESGPKCVYKEEAKEPRNTPALYVKIDPGDPITEVWALRLTDNTHQNTGETEFCLNDFDYEGRVGPECTVLAVNEQGWPEKDKHCVWYISPGGLIKKEYRIWEGIQDYLIHTDCKYEDGDFCVKEHVGIGHTCGCQLAGPGLGLETIGGEEYTTDIYHQHCNDVECDLLEKNDKEEYFWKPKYELLCNSTGYWLVCDETVESVIIEANGKNYECKNRKWVELVEPCSPKKEPYCSGGNIHYCPGDDVSDELIIDCLPGYTCQNAKCLLKTLPGDCCYYINVSYGDVSKEIRIFGRVKETNLFDVNKVSIIKNPNQPIVVGFPL